MPRRARDPRRSAAGPQLEAAQLEDAVAALRGALAGTNGGTGRGDR